MPLRNVRCFVINMNIMKTTSITTSFAIFFAMCFFMAGCQQSNTSTSTVKAAPKPSAVKKVEITIESAKPGFNHTASTSFEVNSNSKADIEIYWDGQKFTSKTDSGITFMEFGPSVAFEKMQTVDFKIKKKVTVTGPDGSITATTSETISVKRNAPKKL